MGSAGLWREIRSGLNLASRRYGGGWRPWAWTPGDSITHCCPVPVSYWDFRFAIGMPAHGVWSEDGGPNPARRDFCSHRTPVHGDQHPLPVDRPPSDQSGFCRGERLQMIPDWLNGCLCGARVVEMTNATTTQFYDPRARTWARGLLERLGLPTHLLPEIVGRARLGRLRDSVGPRIPVIAPATHDTGSAVARTPGATGDPGWAYISSGLGRWWGLNPRRPF